MQRAREGPRASTVATRKGQTCRRSESCGARGWRRFRGGRRRPRARTVPSRRGPWQPSDKGRCDCGGEHTRRHSARAAATRRTSVESSNRSTQSDPHRRRQRDPTPTSVDAAGETSKKCGEGARTACTRTRCRATPATRSSRRGALVFAARHASIGGHAGHADVTRAGTRHKGAFCVCPASHLLPFRRPHDTRKATSNSSACATKT